MNKQVKTRILPLLILSVLFVSSCQKKTQSSVANAIWTVGNIQYTATTIKKQGNAFVASGGLNRMQVYFAVLPVVTANYKIADANKINNSSLAANEVGVIFNVESTDQYLSTGNANDSATVTIQNGVLTIKVLSTPVQHYAGGPALDLNTASGVIKTDKY
ncbi:MAG: hypothetical protein JWQ38_1475 [Flavipsychrobacter sp.]|nr:hypothetical protein [Flavipsychrobacter sp.]